VNIMIKKLLAPAVLAAVLSGCASTSTTGQANNNDPFEGFNRSMFRFNESVDRAVLKPVAQGYVDVVPEGARSCIGNMFGNLGDVWSMMNMFLQNRAPDGINSMFRVLFNSTLGVFGCFDLAAQNGLPRNKADFGQTLGVWGVGSGPYLVLPLLGPSTIRDTAGLAGDFVFDPVSIGQINDHATRYGLYGLKFTDKRAQYLGAETFLYDVSLDPYAFTRDAYLQRRASLIRTGREMDDDEASLPVYEDPDDEPAPVPAAQ